MRAQAGHVARASHVQVHGPPEPRMRRAACGGVRTCPVGSEWACFMSWTGPGKPLTVRGGCYARGRDAHVCMIA